MPTSYYLPLRHASSVKPLLVCVPGAGSSDRPNAEMTFLLTSSWFFRGSKADMLAALTGGACFTAVSTASTHSGRTTNNKALASGLVFYQL